MEAAQLVFPIFIIIGIGYLAARSGFMSATSIDGIDRYVFTFGIPALLFRALANTELPVSPPWGLWLSYYGGALIVWAIGGLIARMAMGRSPADSVIIGFGGGFSNTVMLGVPIILMAYGEEASYSLFLILAFHGLTVFSIATFLLETTKPREGEALSSRQVLLETVLGIIKSPMMIALGTGLAFGQTGLSIPSPLDVTLEMLGRSAIPCALFVLGATLVRYEIKRSVGAASFIALLKLVVHPIVVFGLAFYVFALPALWIKVLVTMAAMPTGVYCSILASRYQAAPGAASSAVVLVTGISLVTLTVVLNLFL